MALVMKYMNTIRNIVRGINRDTAVIMILFVLVTIIYFQVSGYGFVNFDDDAYISDNPFVKKGLSVNSIVSAFTSTHAANWHPITWLSHTLDVTLFGMKPGLHHCVNVLFHLLNSILIYFVFRKMTGDIWKSAFVAALFALHPLHVESVAWLSERKDVLSSFFGVLTLWHYIQYVEKPGRIRYSLTVFFYILGLMSKPMLVTLPFVLLLLDYWPLNRLKNTEAKDIFGKLKSKSQIPNLIVEKVPFIIFAAISCVITFIAQKGGGAVVPVSHSSLGIRIANALVSYVGYIVKMFWPYDLAIPYPFPSSISPIYIWCSVLSLVLVTGIVIRLAQSRPYAIVGWFWYLSTLIPVIGLVQVGYQSMADRYTYLPLIGVFVMIAWGVPDILRGVRHAKVLYMTASVFSIAVLVLLSWIQVQTWQNSMTLFSNSLKKTRNNFVAHLNFGVGLAEKGRIQEAMTHYYESLKIYPKYAKAHYNLGLALDKTGDTEEAIRHYKKAVDIKPGYKKAHLNLGKKLAEKGQIEAALDHYAEALRIDPGYMLAYKNIGAVYEKQGKLNEAVNIYLKALIADPEFVPAYVRIGYILENQGKNAEAIGYYLEALQLSPDLALVHFNLGVLFVKEKRYNDAVYHYSEVLRLNPEDAEAYNNLGTTLIRLGKINAAITAFQSALAIKPDYDAARQNLNNTIKAVEKLSKPMHQDIEKK